MAATSVTTAAEDSQSQRGTVGFYFHPGAAAPCQVLLLDKGVHCAGGCMECPHEPPSLPFAELQLRVLLASRPRRSRCPQTDTTGQRGQKLDACFCLLRVGVSNLEGNTRVCPQMLRQKCYANGGAIKREKQALVLKQRALIFSEWSGSMPA